MSQVAINEHCCECAKAEEAQHRFDTIVRAATECAGFKAADSITTTEEQQSLHRSACKLLSKLFDEATMPKMPGLS